MSVTTGIWHAVEAWIFTLWPAITRVTKRTGVQYFERLRGSACEIVPLRAGNPQPVARNRYGPCDSAARTPALPDYRQVSPERLYGNQAQRHELSMGDTDVVPGGAYLARCVDSSMDLYARFCASSAPHHRGVPLVSGMGTAGPPPPDIRRGCAVGVRLA